MCPFLLLARGKLMGLRECSCFKTKVGWLVEASHVKQDAHLN